MSEYKLKETFISMREIRRAIWHSRQLYPNCRAGQAFCNVYLKNKAKWPEVFYEQDQEKATMKIFEYCTSDLTAKTFFLGDIK